MPKNFKLQRRLTFQPIMGNFRYVDDVDGACTYKCKECSEETSFKHPALHAAVKKNIIQQCKKCKNNAECPYVEHPNNVRECVECGLYYHMIKCTKYFMCLCNLKTKKDEHELYKALSNAGFTLSREEYCLDNNNHKVDIYAEYEDRVLWIEIDGGSHNSRLQTQLDQQFNEDFENAGFVDEYLMRINVSAFSTPALLRQLVEKLKERPESAVNFIF